MKQNKKIKSMVLVLCIWLLVLMIIIVMSVVHISRLDSFSAVNKEAEVRAKWSARAGIQYAVDIITQNPTSFNDSYYILQKFKGSGKRQVSPESYFSLYVYNPNIEQVENGISDESSKINLLTASDKQISELLKVSPDTVKQNFNISGLETLSGFTDSKSLKELKASEYYAKNIRIIASDSQLSLEDCFGEDINLNGILDWNENDGAVFPPSDNADGRLETGLLHYSTLYSYERNIDRDGEPRININFASEADLSDILEISLSEAMWIVENSPYESVAELFPVNIVPEDFNSDINNTASSQKANQVKLNEDGTEEIISAPLSVQTLRRIFNKITVLDDSIIPGKVNINTAGKKVLAAFLGITEEQADKVIKKRDSLITGFYSPAEIFSAGVLDFQQFKDILGKLTVQGNVFTIVSVGMCNDSNVSHTVEATVDVSSMTPNYLYWREY